MSGRKPEAVDRDLRRLRRYMRTPKTVREVGDRFKVNQRTVYRWFDALSDRGHAVMRVGYKRPGRYLAT